MTTQTKGALTLLLVIGAGLGTGLYAGKGVMAATIFGGMIVGGLAMWLTLALAQREDRMKLRASNAKRAGILAGLIALVESAKAIIIVALAIGGAAVLLGWGAFAILSKIQSIRMRNAAKPIIIDGQGAQNNIGTNGVQVAQVSTPPSSTVTAGFQLAAASPGEEAVGLYLTIPVPANMTLEYSTNFVNWGPIFINGPEAIDTYWLPDGPQGFFRLKADQDPENDPTR